MLDRNKTRLMVVPIAVLLVVTMLVAGNQQMGEQKIEVDEDHSEININYIKSGQVKSPEKETTALTSLNNDEGAVEFKVSFQKISSGGSPPTSVQLIIECKGNYSEISLKSLKLSAEVTDSRNYSDNTFDFLLSGNEMKGASLWSSNKIDTGGIGQNQAYIGYNINNNSFDIHNELMWEIYNEKRNQQTLKLTLEGKINEEQLRTFSTIEVNIS